MPPIPASSVPLVFASTSVAALSPAASSVPVAPPDEREALLHVLAQRPGFYVPSLHGETPPAVADQDLRALLPALAPDLGYN